MERPKLKLYSYFRSSCSFRVRIALNLKGLDYEYVPVNLLKGEQHSPEFQKLNPIGHVPVLVDGDIVISDSFAILMYLEEKYPQKPLLPSDFQKRAINYQAANIVSSSIQPLQNIGILADLFLAPQIDAAFKRFKLDMSEYPLLTKLHGTYAEMPAFQAAMPENQPDTPSTS